MADLIQQVERDIATRTLFAEGEAILVAVSGGLDSMVLLHLLHRLGSALGWQLAVAHLNHQLRGRSSDADERLVRATARTLGLRFIAGRGRVRRLSEREGLSIEMAARRLRHEFLARAARRLGFRTIALAHHADDQVELFFVRLLRGAGAGGLAGMKWSNPSPADARIRLARPLLGCVKGELKRFARKARIPFHEDTTNAGLDPLRNRIRHELVPLLQRRYQPALGRTTRRLMEILGAEAAWVAAAARAWLGRRRRACFSRLPVAVQRQVLHRQLGDLGIDRIDFERIEWLRNAPGTRLVIRPDLALSRRADGTLERHRMVTAGFGTKRRLLDLIGVCGACIFDGAQVAWQVQEQPGVRRPRNTPGCEYFDAERVGPAVVLRHWRKGDRFQPIGMPRPVKLQDWFTNRKVPRAQRHELLVATTGAGEIFWVEGQRIGERFKLDKGTRCRLKWTWTRD